MKRKGGKERGGEVLEHATTPRPPRPNPLPRPDTNKWFLPCSNRKPLRVVLGKRLKVSKSAEPTQEQVDALHRKFYEEVVRCWEKHHKEMGFADRTLVYVQ
jgi:hypothetical protein